MRIAILSLAMAAGLSPALAAGSPRSESVSVGPWRVEAAYKGDRFERCVMSRTTDEGVDVRFVRDGDGLDLSMASSKWKLGRGKTYPVELAAGSATVKAEVAADGNTVSLPIADDRFVRALRQADGLEVRGDGSTIKVALVGSAAALDRLEACLAKNRSQTETNPFVAPSRKP